MPPTIALHACKFSSVVSTAYCISLLPAHEYGKTSGIALAGAAIFVSLELGAAICFALGRQCFLKAVGRALEDERLSYANAVNRLMQEGQG